MKSSSYEHFTYPHILERLIRDKKTPETIDFLKNSVPQESLGEKYDTRV